MANLKVLKNKVLVVGSNGLLGQKIVSQFRNGFELTGIGRRKKSSVTTENFSYQQCDMTDRSELRRLVKECEPKTIVNCAAYTNVDGCEDQKEECWRVNVTGVEHLAGAARSVGASLLHISTDYVFDGAGGPYSETSAPNPISYYGRAKLASENAVVAAGIEHAVIRTMVLYGTGVDINPNFVTWLVGKLSKGERVRIVEDQFGHPTLADDLAMAIRRIIELHKTGVFHVAGKECLSRHTFALKVADVFGFDKGLIQRIKTADLEQKAPRPLNSEFKLDKIRNELGIELNDVAGGLRIVKQQFESSGKPISGA